MKLVLVNELVPWTSIDNNKVSVEQANISTSLVHSYYQDRKAKRLLSKVLSECEDNSFLKCDIKYVPPNAFKLKLRSCEDVSKNILQKLHELFQDGVEIAVRIDEKGSHGVFQTGGMRIKWKGGECVCSFVENSGLPYSFSWMVISSMLAKASRIHLNIIADLSSVIVFDDFVSFEETNIVKKNKRILEEGIGSDVIITSANGTVIKAHKGFLFEASPVLLTMFATGLEEYQTNCVDMSDIVEDAIQAFLSFIYYEDLSKSKATTEIANEVLYAAHKYQVPSLEVEMISHLLLIKEENFTVELAFRMYSFIRNIDAASDLKLKAVRIMKSKLEELEKLEEYKELFRKSPNDAMELCCLLAKSKEN